MPDRFNALKIQPPPEASGNVLAAPAAPNWAGAYDATGQWLADQRAQSVAMGLLDPNTGLPTMQGLQHGAGMYGNALAMGSISPRMAPFKATGSLAEVQSAWDKLGINHAISEGDGTITLSKIVVPADARNQGVGSQALQHLADYADTTGQRIVLTPSKDFGATSMSRLADFYKNLGFKANKGRSRDFTTRESMIRDPQDLPEPGQ